MINGERRERGFPRAEAVREQERRVIQKKRKEIAIAMNSHDIFMSGDDGHSKVFAFTSTWLRYARAHTHIHTNTRRTVLVRDDAVM